MSESFRLNLSPRQRRAYYTPATEVLYGGAAGGGKSLLLRLSAIRWLNTVPGIQIYFFRRTFPELRDNHLRGPTSFFRLLEYGLSTGDVVYRKQENEFVNNTTNSRIVLCHCQYEDDVERYQGAEIHVLIIDELTHFCMHPDTDVMTKTGWKKICDVIPGEMVASIDNNYEMTWKEATRVWAFDYDGDLVNVDSRKGLKMSVTPNHKVLVSGQKNNKWRFERADSLPSYPRLVYGGRFKNKDLKKTKKFKLLSGRGFGKNQNSANKISINDWAEILGWYLSEGSAFGGNKSPRISIRQTKQNSGLKSLMARLPWRIKEIKNEGYLIFSRQLYEELKPLGNLYEKRVPQEVFDWPIESIDKLIDAFISGDGHIDKYNCVSIGLANEMLRDDMARLMVMSGYKVTCSFSKNKHAGAWRISANRRKRFSIEHNKNNFSKENYSGKVWCLTVEPNHNFVARYKGSVFVTGNTEYQYRFLRSRVRISGVEVPEKFADRLPRIECASNPGNVGHAFVKGMFRPNDSNYIDKRWRAPKSEGGMLRHFIPAKLKDNIELLKSDPNYEDRLDGLGSSTLVQAMKDGNWDIFAGQYFEKWDRSIHVLPKDFEIQSWWDQFGGYDHGFSHPFCWGAYATDGDGNIIKFAEAGDRGMESDQIASAIEEAYLDAYGVRGADDKITSRVKAQLNSLTNWAGHDVWAQHHIEIKYGGRAMVEQLRQHGLSMVRATIDRKNGAAWLRSLLDWRKDADGNFIKKPKLYIRENCWRTINCLPMMQVNENDPEDVKKMDATTENVWAGDDPYDETRYAVMSRWRPSRPEVRPPPKGSGGWFIELLEREGEYLDLE